MIIASPQEPQIQRNFFNHIYKPCIEKFPLLSDIDINHGRKVLNTEAECDKYIAWYGGHHFYKLYAAFDSTNFRYIDTKSIEIIDWGCGQAIATCVLIDYLNEKYITPKVDSITLIEPSSFALNRGYSFIHQVFQPNLSHKVIIRKVNKYIDDLKPSDFMSRSTNIKVHLFSNILDIEDFDLNKLYQLIINCFEGINRMICTSPYHRGKNYRINDFYNFFNHYPRVKNTFYSDKSIYQEFFYAQTRRFEIREIKRYERQFTIKL